MSKTIFKSKKRPAELGDNHSPWVSFTSLVGCDYTSVYDFRRGLGVWGFDCRLVDRARTPLQGHCLGFCLTNSENSRAYEFTHRETRQTEKERVNASPDIRLGPWSPFASSAHIGTLRFLFLTASTVFLWSLQFHTLPYPESPCASLILGIQLPGSLTFSQNFWCNDFILNLYWVSDMVLLPPSGIE